MKKNNQLITIFICIVIFLITILSIAFAEIIVTEVKSSTKTAADDSYSVSLDSEHYVCSKYSDAISKCDYTITIADMLSEEQCIDYSTIKIMSDNYGIFDFQNSFSNLEDYEIQLIKPINCNSNNAIMGLDGICYKEQKNVIHDYTKIQDGKYLICSKNHTRTFTGSFFVPFGSSGKFSFSITLNKTYISDPTWTSINTTFLGTFNNTEVDNRGYLTLKNGYALNDSNTLFLARFDNSNSSEDGDAPISMTTQGTNNGVTYQTGKFNQGINNSGGYFTYNATNNILLNLSGTVEFWAKPDIIGQSTVRYLFDTYNGTGNINRISISTRANEGGNIWFLSYNATGGNSIIVSGGLIVNKWVHLAFAWNDTNNSIYVNGNYKGTILAGSRGGQTSPRFTMGGAITQNSPFNGIIDDLRIYNRSRTAAEIYQDYNSSYYINKTNTYTSEVFDAGIEANWSVKSINSITSPNFCTANISWKSCANSDCSDGTFSAAEQLNLSVNNYNLSISQLRYFQYYIQMQTNNSNVSHAVKNVDVTYLRNLSQGIPILNMTTNRNTTADNLTIYNQSTYGLNITNIINWYRNGTSIMVLNMPFDGGSLAGNASGVPNATKDYSGFGATAILFNTTWNATGRDGSGAYTFDLNKKDYMNISYIPAFNITDNMSVEMWCNVKVLGLVQCVVAKHVSSGAGSGWLMFINTDNKFYWQAAGSSGGWGGLSTTSTAISSTGWYHVVGVHNLTDHAIYVNGIFNGTDTSPQGAMNTNKLDIWISRNIAASTTYYNGTIDVLRIYNRSLSAQQIQALYNNRTDLIVSQELIKGEIWSACISATDIGGQIDEKCSNNVTIKSTDITAPNITWLNQTNNLTYSGSTETIRFNITDNNSTITDSRMILNNTATNNLYEVNGSVELGGTTSMIYNYSFMMREIGIYQCKINATDLEDNINNTGWFNCYNVTETPTNITPFTPTNANPYTNTWIYAEINASSEIKGANITLNSNCSLFYYVNNKTQLLGNITNTRASWYVYQTEKALCSFNVSMNDDFNNSWYNDNKTTNYKYITTASLKAVTVSGTIYRGGDKMSQFARCLDENNQLISSTANITIWYPNMTTHYTNNSGMTRIIDGLFNYSGTTPNITGVYPFTVSCYAGSNSAVEGGDFQVAEWTQTINDINSTQNNYFLDWNNTFYYWNNTVFIRYDQNFSVVFNRFGIIQSNFTKVYDQFNCTKLNNSVCDYLRYLNSTLANNTESFKATIINHPVFYVGNQLYAYFITQNQKGSIVEPQELNIVIYPSNETNITWSYNLSSLKNETIGVYFINETITSNLTSGSYVISLNSTYNNITTYQKSTFRISKGAFDISIDIKNPKKTVYRYETVNFTVTLTNNEDVTDDGLLTCSNGFHSLSRSLLVDPGETKTFPLDYDSYNLATDIQQNRENSVNCDWEYDAKPAASASEPYSERLSRRAGIVQDFSFLFKKGMKEKPLTTIGITSLMVIVFATSLMFLFVFARNGIKKVTSSHE